MVTRFAAHFADADLATVGAWTSHLYNKYIKMASRTGLSQEQIQQWPERRPGVFVSPEDEAGAALTCLVQALHYANTESTERVLDEIQRHQKGEQQEHINTLRHNCIREPLTEWPIPSLDIPLYCSFLSQPSATIYDVTFSHAHYNREFRMSMGLSPEPAEKEIDLFLDSKVDEDSVRELSEWDPEEMKAARQSAARVSGDMLDALWLQYFYNGDKNVLRKILEVATCDVNGVPEVPCC